MDEHDEKEPDDPGHIVFLAVVALITVAYLREVVTVSTHINNIILVVPLAILLLVLTAVLLAHGVVARRRAAGKAAPRDVTAAPGARSGAEPAAEPGAEIAAQSGDDIRRALVLLGALGAYTWLYDIIGLDVATFLFVAGGLLLLGIRGRVFVPVFATIFTVVVVGGADLLLHYPMFTAILP